MIPTLLFIAWSAAWNLTYGFSEPAWHDRELRQLLYRDHPPVGCYVLKQRHTGLRFVLWPRFHETKDVLCWQESQLVQEQ